MEEHLAQLVEQDNILTQFFSNRFLSSLASKINFSENKFTERQKTVLELITRVFQVHQRLSDEFKKEYDLVFEVSDELKKTIKII